MTFKTISNDLYDISIPYYNYLFHAFALGNLGNVKYKFMGSIVEDCNVRGSFVAEGPDTCQSIGDFYITVVHNNSDMIMMQKYDCENYDQYEDYNIEYIDPESPDYPNY